MDMSPEGMELPVGCPRISDSKAHILLFQYVELHTPYSIPLVPPHPVTLLPPVPSTRMHMPMHVCAHTPHKKEKGPVT